MLWGWGGDSSHMHGVGVGMEKKFHGDAAEIGLIFSTLGGSVV